MREAYNAYKYDHRKVQREQREQAQQALHLTRVAVLERETGLKVGVLESDICIWYAVYFGLFA